MKKLSNKFDNLPQDFDREAIWQGIATPKVGLWYATAVTQPGTILLGLAVAAVAVVLVKEPQPVVFGMEAPATESIITAPELDESVFTLSGQKISEKERTATAGRDAFEPTPIDAITSHVGPGPATEFTAAGHTIPGNATNGKALVEQSSFTSDDSQTISSTGDVPGRTSGTATGSETDIFREQAPENAQSWEVDSEEQPFGSFNALAGKPAKTEYKPALSTAGILDRSITPRRYMQHHLVLRTGLGWHNARFTAGTEGNAEWRQTLEQPQLDYTFGLRYELGVGRNYLLSVSASYHLYKDRITTGFVRDSMGRDWQYDYLLHNHYHVFTAQLELGKRFYYRGFFWDVQAGAGGKLYQISEGDYFLDDGALVSQQQFETDYRTAPRLFFTGQVAIGRYLSDGLFFRTGAQVYSGIDLTGPEAAIAHRIVPVQVFCEMGMRF